MPAKPDEMQVGQTNCTCLRRSRPRSSALTSGATRTGRNVLPASFTTLSAANIKVPVYNSLSHLLPLRTLSSEAA